MKLVFGVEQHGHEIMDNCAGTFLPGLHQVISNTRDGAFVGGVVFSDFTGRSCQMHQYGHAATWITRDILWAAFHYPFVQLDCASVIGLVPASNEHAVALNKKYGFREMIRLPAVYPSGACVIMQMMREDCRWLKLQPRTVKPGY